MIQRRGVIAAPFCLDLRFISNTAISPEIINFLNSGLNHYPIRRLYEKGGETGADQQIPLAAFLGHNPVPGVAAILPPRGFWAVSLLAGSLGDGTVPAAGSGTAGQGYLRS